jgi:general secretion pathway protein D
MNWHRLIFPVAIVAFAGAAHAAEDMVTLNFVNADIESVVKAVGKITQRNFLIDPRVKGTINIVSGRPIPAALTYQVLLAALRLQGFAAVDSRGVTLILPEADAKQHGMATGGKNPLPRGNQMTTEVFTLKYESAAQLVPILRPLVAPNNPVTAYPASNTIVVTDYADNLRRIAQIIESIDQPTAFEAVVVPVRNLAAADLAALIMRMQVDNPGASSDPGQRLSVVPEPHSNSLVIRSDNPSRVARVRTLIEKLDVPGATPGNVHVIYLRNADAVKLAQTLRAVATGETAAAAPAAGGAAAGAAPTGSGMIQADAASNALIITAPEAVFGNLRAVVERLDVKRAQVHIEALIAEVTTDKATELGVQWQGISVGSARTAIVAGTNFSSGGNNILGATAGAGSGTPALPSSGFNLGVLNQINLPGGGTAVNLSLLAKALETDAQANILSTPNLLTLDNEEASIVIGQNVPFITGQYAQSGGGAGVTPTPFQTIERKDVGLTLKVKPQITEGGTIRLQVFQEVSSVDSQSNTAGIITNKRALQSNVLLADGQTIVLGGLIQDSMTNGQEKVPLLGDIPILGGLFSYDKKRRTKTNLMVFLRPTIIRDGNVPARLTADRYDYVIGAQAGGPEDVAHLPAFAPAPASPAAQPAATPPAAAAPAPSPTPAKQ